MKIAGQPIVAMLIGAILALYVWPAIRARLG